MSLLSFFSPHFIIELFFVAMVQYLRRLLHSMVISPHGTSGVWQTWYQVRKLFPSLFSRRSGLFLAASFFRCSFFVSGTDLLMFHSIMFFFLYSVHRQRFHTNIVWMAFPTFHRSCWVLFSRYIHGTTQSKSIFESISLWILPSWSILVRVWWSQLSV